MRFDELNEDNYLLFAIKFYDNPHALTKEDFEDDLKRIKCVLRTPVFLYLLRSLLIYLILNHLTVLFNVFDDAAVPLLFYNLEQELWPCIKSFLLFLKRVPEYPKSHIHGIPEDQICVAELKSI